VLSRTADAEVSLLHVVNGPENRTEGEGFLTAWAAENGLSDAERIVDDSGDVEGAIAREAADNTLVIIGATEKGLLSRLVSNSPASRRDPRRGLFGAARRAPEQPLAPDRLFGPGRRVSGPPDGGASSAIRTRQAGRRLAIRADGGTRSPMIRVGRRRRNG